MPQSLRQVVAAPWELTLPKGAPDLTYGSNVPTMPAEHAQEPHPRGAGLPTHPLSPARLLMSPMRPTHQLHHPEAPFQQAGAAL